MANVKKMIAAGLDRIQWGVNSGGYLKGITGTLANGADAGMGLLYAKASEYKIPESVKTAITANDSLLGTFQFGSTDPSSFNLTLGAGDLDMMAKAQGTLVRTLGSWSLSLLRPGTLTFSNIVLLLTSVSKSMESGSVGNAGFIHALLPSCQLFYLGRSGISERGEQAFEFAVIVNPVDKWPWGELLSASADGATLADGDEWYTDNRVSMHTHVGDGSDTSFTLQYKPVVASGASNFVWKNGTALVYTTDFTLVTATGVVTEVAAPAAAAVVVMAYEHAGG